MERATRSYETFIPLADSYLVGRGLDLNLAGTYRLGVVAEPEIGHETFSGRLAIPYLTRAGVVNIKFRCIEHQDCKAVGCPKYLNLGPPLGTNIYNTQAFFTETPVIAITEGEIDSMVLHSLVEIPAVAIPGVKNWKRHYERCFSDFERILVFADGDEPGRDFAKHIASVLDGVTVVRMPDEMDVSTVYQAEGPDGLRKRAGL